MYRWLRRVPLFGRIALFSATASIISSLLVLTTLRGVPESISICIFFVWLAIGSSGSIGGIVFGTLMFQHDRIWGRGSTCVGMAAGLLFLSILLWPVSP